MSVKFTDNTDFFKRAIYKAMEDAANDIGKTIVGEIQANTPVKTSALKKSMTFVKTNSKAKIRVTLGSPLKYAPYVEYRPSRVQYFMTKTIRNNKEEILRIVKKHLRKVGR
ncbi:MAG: HK97 gp10 family phage protein [Peptostreptococcaceae bacterium]